MTAYVRNPAGFKYVKPFVQARYYTPGPRRNPTTLLVVHDMEAPEKGTTAENVADYFHRGPADAKGKPIKASAHTCIDSDSIVPCVRETDIAYAAPGANHNGIQMELAGYARQSRDEWMDAYGLAMLSAGRPAAWYVRDVCGRLGIPLVVADLTLSVPRGITTHAAVTKQYGQSTHTDPGPNFPMAWFLEQVRAS